jgi:hypothetical protein
MSRTSRVPANRTRRIAAGSLLLLGLSANDGAAGAQELPDVESLRPASSPAFIVLGVAPSSISRPNNPADLGFTVLNTSSGLTELPQNLAVEFSPYWLQNRRELTWREDVTRTVQQSFLRSLAFSAATSQSGTDSSRTALAVGGRALLFSGRVSPEAIRRMEAREAELAGISALVDRITLEERRRIATLRTAALKRALDTVPPGSPRYQAIADSVGLAFEPAEREAVARALADSAAVVERELNALEEFVVVREGPKLEVAGAGSWAFTDQRARTGKLDRVGLWATYSCDNCRFVGSAPARVTPMVLARFLRNVEEDDTDLADVGGRLALDGNGYSFSAEGVRRTFLGDDGRGPLWRIAGILEYEVAEDSWLLASFGRDYRSPDRGDLIARFGIKVNFVRDRYRAVNTPPGT